MSYCDRLVHNNPDRRACGDAGRALEPRADCSSGCVDWWVLHGKEGHQASLCCEHCGAAGAALSLSCHLASVGPSSVQDQVESTCCNGGRQACHCPSQTTAQESTKVAAEVHTAVCLSPEGGHPHCPGNTPEAFRGFCIIDLGCKPSLNREYQVKVGQVPFYEFQIDFQILNLSSWKERGFSLWTPLGQLCHGMTWEKSAGEDSPPVMPGQTACPRATQTVQCGGLGGASDCKEGN